jgi:two-component system, NtrC family, response regulator AtoC
MPSLNVLVIDDEPAAREMLAAAVKNAGYSVEAAASVAEAERKLATGDVDVALCDIQLPDGDGLELFKRTRAAGSETLFVMVTAFASVETAVEALRAGAFDYIMKPMRHSEVLHRLAQIEAFSGLRQENKALRRAARDSKPLYRFNSEPMRKIDRIVEKIAPTAATVLIVGESGTGKGVIAHAIHERSERADAPFLSVNCAAIPDQLLESEFFGHAKGAFTNADRARKGLFLEADHGTLFLDEIGELPLTLQTKLLHVIEDKEVRPLGAARSHRVDCRILAATNRDLGQMVRESRFREDLYFRLSLFEVRIPPLRERADDLRGLIQFFLLKNGCHKGGVRPLELDPDALAALTRYAWPGNVRELENVITRACILADGSSIAVDDLSTDVARALPRNTTGSLAATTSGTLHDQRRRFEAAVIQRAVHDAGGDRRLAAQRLGISLSGLYGKMSETNGADGDVARGQGQGAAGGGPPGSEDVRAREQRSFRNEDSTQ